MMKCRMVCLSVVLALLGLAPAQSSQARSSSAKSGSAKSGSAKSSSDPLTTSTKPLTPKSAMPSHRKGAVATPKAAASTSRTTAQLGHLERQNSQAVNSKSGSASPAKAPVKSAASSGSSSKIDFKYQKPADGQKAPPSATSTPRKQN